MTAHIRINCARVIEIVQTHLVMSHQSDLAMNILVVVSKRALVIINNLSDGHLQSKKISIY